MLPTNRPVLPKAAGTAADRRLTGCNASVVVEYGETAGVYIPAMLSRILLLSPRSSIEIFRLPELRGITFPPVTAHIVSKLLTAPVVNSAAEEILLRNPGS